MSDYISTNHFAKQIFCKVEFYSSSTTWEFFFVFLIENPLLGLIERIKFSSNVSVSNLGRWRSKQRQPRRLLNNADSSEKLGLSSGPSMK